MSFCQTALDVICASKSFADAEKRLLRRRSAERIVAVDRVCDRLAIINRGVIIAEDTPRGLKRLVRTGGREPMLEEVFMELTGKRLKEEDDVLEI